MPQKDLGTILNQPGFDITKKENGPLYTELKQKIRFKKTSSEELSNYLVSKYHAKELPSDSAIMTQYKKTFFKNIKDPSAYPTLSKEPVHFRGFQVDPYTSFFFENNYGYFVASGIHHTERVEPLFKELILFRGIQEIEFIRMTAIAIQYILYLYEETT